LKKAVISPLKLFCAVNFQYAILLIVERLGVIAKNLSSYDMQSAKGLPN